jgi:hypothetical protein
MSHAPFEVRPIVLDGGAVDIPADEVTTDWRATDDTCDVVLSDGTHIISARTAPETADAVRADILQRVQNGESTPVLASHLDQVGLRAALLEWAQGH